MKPAAFEYHQPDTVDEVFTLLSEHGSASRILAGGQSLVPLMNMRILSPSVIIDINRCKEFSYIREEGNSVVCGALTRQGEAETSKIVGGRVPLMAQAMPHVGVRANRNFGTVCGSLAHADPLAELPTVATALEACFVIGGVRGTREVGAGEFFESALSNCVEPDEMLVAVKLPFSAEGSKSVFLEIANRAHGFAVAGLAAVTQIDASGRCSQARLSAMGAGDTTARLHSVEALLEGQILEDEIIREAAALAESEAEAPADVHASSEYRAHAVGTLVSKALKQMTGNSGV